MDILSALAVGVADGVAHRSTLRREIMEILARAGVTDPRQASRQDLARVVRLLFVELQIRRDARVAEVIVLLGHAGEVLGRPEIDAQPDMWQLRALMDAVRDRRDRRAGAFGASDVAGGRVEDIGAYRAGHGGGRQSVAVAQAHAAAAGQ